MLWTRHRKIYMKEEKINNKQNCLSSKQIGILCNSNNERYILNVIKRRASFLIVAVANIKKETAKHNITQSIVLVDVVDFLGFWSEGKS